MWSNTTSNANCNLKWWGVALKVSKNRYFKKYWWNSPPIWNCKLEIIYRLFTLLNKFIQIKTCARLPSLDDILQVESEIHNNGWGPLKNIKIVAVPIFCNAYVQLKTKPESLYNTNILKMHIKKCQHLRKLVKLSKLASFFHKFKIFCFSRLSFFSFIVFLKPVLQIGKK